MVINTDENETINKSIIDPLDHLTQYGTVTVTNPTTSHYRAESEVDAEYEIV